MAVRVAAASGAAAARAGTPRAGQHQSEREHEPTLAPPLHRVLLEPAAVLKRARCDRGKLVARVTTRQYLLQECALRCSNERIGERGGKNGRGRRQPARAGPARAHRLGGAPILPRRPLQDRNRRASSGSVGSRSPGCSTTPGPAAWSGSRSATRATIDIELSGRLMDALGLQHCVVTDTPDEHPAAIREHLGAAAAELLTELITPDDVLGLSWARSVSAMAIAVKQLATVPVVQLTGALRSARGRRELDRAGARRGPGRPAGRPTTSTRPMSVADAATARALRRQPEVAQALARIPSVTKAVAGVGAWAPGQSTLYDATGEAERADAAPARRLRRRVRDHAGRPGSTRRRRAVQAHDRNHRRADDRPSPR